MKMLAMVTVLLAAFKLAGLTHISWWLVATPLLIGVGATIGFSLFIAIFAIIASDK
jgi:hypothetical protein